MREKKKKKTNSQLCEPPKMASPLKRRTTNRNSSLSIGLDMDLHNVDETGGAESSDEKLLQERDSERDFYSNFSLLVVLYMLQGVPLGLAGGTLPFMLKVRHFLVFLLFFVVRALTATSRG